MGQLLVRLWFSRSWPRSYLSVETTDFFNVTNWFFKSPEFK